MQQQLFTLAEVGRRLDVLPQTLHYWRKYGSIPYPSVKLGLRMRYTLEEFEQIKAFVEQLRMTA